MVGSFVMNGLGTRAGARKPATHKGMAALPAGRTAAPPRRPRACPPSLSGGVYSQKEVQSRVSVHWLQGTCPSDKLSDLVCYLDTLYGGTHETIGYGQYGYDRTFVWQPWGVRVWWDSVASRGVALHNERVTVCIPGSALEHLSGEQVYSLCRTLCYQYWFGGTRVDCAFDDFEHVIKPCDLVPIAERSDFTGYRRWQHISPRRLNGSREGDQIAFGRRGKDGSGRYLRVYDKGLESGGVLNSVRWEIEFSKDRARDVAFRLACCEDVQEFGALVGALVGGSIDFVTRTGRAGDKNLARLERPEFWQRIVAILGRAKLANREPNKSVQNAVRWVEKSVAASLAMLREAYGAEDFTSWLMSVVNDGAERLSSRQLAMVDAFHHEGGWTRLTEHKSKGDWW